MGTPHVTSYSDILAAFGLTTEAQGPWAIVGQTTRVQGWKIHLSSVPLEAAQLLSAVVPLLRDRGISFKIAKSEADLFKLNEGTLGSTQIGKFATIYPGDDEEARCLVEKLIPLTRGYHGPFIVTDLKLADVVYTRYGSFAPVITRDRLGQSRPSIYGTDGLLRPDAYEVPFIPPADVPNPFHALLSGPDNQETGSEGAASIKGSGKLLGPGTWCWK